MKFIDPTHIAFEPGDDPEEVKRDVGKALNRAASLGLVAARADATRHSDARSYIGEYLLAKYLGVKAWELHRVPEKIKQEALVILRARQLHKEQI